MARFSRGRTNTLVQAQHLHQLQRQASLRIEWPLLPHALFLRLLILLPNRKVGTGFAKHITMPLAISLMGLFSSITMEAKALGYSTSQWPHVLRSPALQANSSQHLG